MGSLGMDFLFTKLPLEEAIEIYANKLYKQSDTVDGLSESEFRELLFLATRDLHFIFNGTLYKQTVVIV